MPGACRYRELLSGFDLCEFPKQHISDTHLQILQGVLEGDIPKLLQVSCFAPVLARLGCAYG